MNSSVQILPLDKQVEPIRKRKKKTLRNRGAFTSGYIAEEERTKKKEQSKFP